MADRSTERRWLEQLTSVPTAPGYERRVLDWVRAWVARRSDLQAEADRHGNLLITQRGRKQRDPVLAVAHTDHPGFVVIETDGRWAWVEFRGGVRPEYFAGARLEFYDGNDRPHRGRLEEFDHEASTGTVLMDRVVQLSEGDVGRWSFRSSHGISQGLLRAPACDDLAGAAAALAALDRARGDASRRHFGVLLTRAEEVGFVGAIGACRDGTIPPAARLLSIECSRAFAESPVGGGPVVRVGDASTVFDHELTNLVAEAANESGIRHQRRLMAGGSCEATAFLAYGYRATGLCLALGNYHNMGDLDQVEQGTGKARPMPEVVSLEDFYGLVELLGEAVAALDGEAGLRSRLDSRFQASAAILA